MKLTFEGNGWEEYLALRDAAFIIEAQKQNHLTSSLRAKRGNPVLGALP
jgi:hypothetical protein